MKRHLSLAEQHVFDRALRRSVNIKADYEDDNWHALKPHLTVYEPTEEPRPTGLIDAQGNPIVCFESKQSIGFGPFHFNQEPNMYDQHTAGEGLRDISDGKPGFAQPKRKAKGGK